MSVRYPRIKVIEARFSPTFEEGFAPTGVTAALKTVLARVGLHNIDWEHLIEHGGLVVWVDDVETDMGG